MDALLGAVAILARPVSLSWLRLGTAMGAVIVMIALVAAVTAPALAKDTKAATTTVKGIGISRAKAIALFKTQGCPLKKTDKVNGQERWMGQKGLVICEAIGPAADLQKIFLLHGVVKDNLSSGIRAMGVAAEIFRAISPQWTDSSKWVLETVKTQGGSTVRDGRKFEISLRNGLGLGISVETAPADEPKAGTATVKGIGVSRSDLEALYTRLGFAQKKETPVDGNDNIVGQVPDAVSQIVAKENTVLRTSILTFISTEDNKNRDSGLRMVVMVGAVFPGWEEGMDWVMTAIGNHGDIMTRDGKVLKVTVKKEVGAIMLSIMSID